MSPRMSAGQRRSQLVEVAKSVFAEYGYDGASIEEIAARAGVSKPIVYEHFGGKEGLFAVVADRESAKLLEMIAARLGPDIAGREQIHNSAMAFLDYIDEDPAGFRVLTRDSPAGFGSGTMAGLLADVAAKAQDILAANFRKGGLDPSVAPLYAHALVGMVVHVGAWWAEERRPGKEAVAAHLTALCYAGLRRLGHEPVFAGSLPAGQSAASAPCPDGAPAQPAPASEPRSMSPSDATVASAASLTPPPGR